jgi:hypothetical protein
LIQEAAFLPVQHPEIARVVEVTVLAALYAATAALYWTIWR